MSVDTATAILNKHLRRHQSASSIHLVRYPSQTIRWLDKGSERWFPMVLSVFYIIISTREIHTSIIDSYIRYDGHCNYIVIDNTHQSCIRRISRINHMRNTMRGACVNRPLPTLNAVSLCASACFCVGLNILLSSASMFIIYCVKKCVKVCNYIRIYAIQVERYYFGIA